MADQKWTPLDPKTGGRIPEDAPIEGVPDWLAHLVWAWVCNYIIGSLHYDKASEVLDTIALKLKLNLGERHNAGHRRDLLKKHCWNRLELLLLVADLALHEWGAGPTQLEDILDKAGSAWTVAPDRRALSRRVLPEAQAAARIVVESGTNAGILIGRAWRRIYGRDPDATAGYSEAVRAAEAAVCPVILPNDKSATLGRAIGTLRKRPAGKFKTVFTNSRDVDPLDGVLALMDLVWTNEYARHAADPTVPLHISQPEAEAALHAAVTIVQWFQREFVQAT